ncbi:MAG TPA: AAA family ATPase, partial [Chloroflexota bacterium]|nr:AAA family ATPase [Chloroflexota bacterium]
FGTLLRRTRRAAGLTQEALAERSGVSARTISDLERGVHHAPHADTAALLAETLGLRDGDLAAFVTATGRLRSRRARPTEGRGPTQVGAGSDVAPFVGRQGEVALLEAHLAGQGPAVLLLAGEPGIGKTRLVHGSIPRAVAQGWRVLEGGCRRQGGQEPYAPVLEALQGTLRRQSPKHLRTALAGCAWLVRLLPELADGPIESLPTWTVPAEQERRLVFTAVARLLTNVAGRAGTLLVLDDLQWAGPDALDLLAALMRGATEAPLRVIGAYRDSEVQPHDPLGLLLADLAHMGVAAHRRLAPLAPAEAAALLDRLLPAADAAPRLQVLERAGGVPFFLVSYVHGLRQAPTYGEPVGVPWNVVQSVRQRVTALPEAARNMLGIAAVIGRHVQHDVLRTVAARSEHEVLDALEAARHAHLLEEAGTTTYRFTHDVIREVVEGDLGTARRMLLHRQIAQGLQSRVGPPDVEQLAYHYARSDQPEQALPYLAGAAEQAREAAAYQEESALLAQAIELARQVGREDLLGDLHALRGKAQYHLTLMAEAQQEMLAALAALVPERQERQAEILLDLALTSYWFSDAASTRRHGNEALALATKSGREDLEIAALGALVLADSSDGEHQVGLDRYRQVATRAGARFPAAVAPGMMMASAMFYWLADFDNAIQCAGESIAFSRATHDTSTLAQAQGNLGCALMGSGRYAEALQVFTEVQRASAEQGAVNWLARTTAMRGGLHLDLDDFAVAETLAEEAREISRSLGWMNALASAGIDLLLNFTRRGEIGRADRLLAEVAEQVAQGQGTHGWLWRLRFVQAQAELAQAHGDHEQALRWADEAIARSRKHGRTKYQVAGLQVRAQALMSLGRQPAAITDLQSAVRQARETGDPAMYVRAAAALLTIDGTDALLAEARVAVERITGALPDLAMRRRFAEADPVRAIVHSTRA